MKSKLETTVVALVASMAIAGCGNNAKEQSTDDVVAIDLNNSDSVIDYRDVIAVDGWTQLSDVDEGIVSGVVKMAVETTAFTCSTDARNVCLCLTRKEILSMLSGIRDGSRRISGWS